MPEPRPPWVEAGSPRGGPPVQRREIETPRMDPGDVVEPDFAIAWACHHATERFALLMRDLATAAPAMSAEERAETAKALLAMDPEQ